MPTNAIILAAGAGTRMKSRHPKVTHKLLDKPLVWWSVQAAKQAGAERIFVVIGHGADEVKAALEGVNDLIFIEQTEQLGTGHAVACVANQLESFEGPVMLTYGDSPLIEPATLARMVEMRAETHSAAVVLTMTPPDPTGYGRVILNGDTEDPQVSAIVEEKDCTPEQRAITLSNSGVYVFCGRRLKKYISQLTNNNAQGEYYITDMVEVYQNNNEPVRAFEAPSYEETLGVNSRAQLAEATALMQERINRRLMDAGVSMLDPKQVWVGPEVEVGQDTLLMPQTMLWGNTRVGTDCVIGPNTRLTNVQVASNSTVEETVAYDAVMDEGVLVGPRAYIRPGTHLLKGAHVGTHVEIKNSTIGAGSKVPHLSYIGDTQMGAGVNIGAGSITCNYDGVNKHRTTIGDRVFVGSDTMMVAPVTIGDDALVGASSCITRDVPAGALALERSEQKMVEGAGLARMEHLRAQKAARQH